LRHDRVGKGKSLRRSALFIDLVRDLHSINTHVVSAAYPIVEEAGLLRDTRLRG
jgi:phosphate:Na+ symporter